MRLVPVFDLGNVLLPFSFDSFFEKLHPHSREGTAIEETFWRHHHDLQIDRGGDFALLHPLMVRDVGLTLALEEFRAAYQDIFTPNRAMWELVRRCPRPRLLLSNTSEPHVNWIRQRFPDVFPLFDNCVFSYQVGLCKPEAAVYRYVESISGQPSECHLLVDDLEQHIVGARAVGWQAVRFQGFEDCRQRLAELALLDGETTAGA